jgi:transposase InsO family protein
MKKKTKQNQKEQYLKQIYYNPSKSASFSGIQKISHYLKNTGKKYKYSQEEIEKWLKKQEGHTTNILANYTTKRRKVIVPYLDYMWDMDCASMRDYSKENRGYKHFLLAIDIMSRYVWAQPIKTPNGEEVKKALKVIFADNRIPERVRTDKGSEFVNNTVQTYLKEKNIKHFVTQNEVKANYAERSIRTIKGKIMRYMRAEHTEKWIDQFQNFIDSYNNTYHRSIKQSPKSVKKSDENHLWELLYPANQIKIPKKKLSYKFNIGDIVRISRLRQPFQRYYNEHWTNELFFVRERNFQQYIPVYKLSDYAKDEIKGTFYENELQKVYTDENAVYSIEKVIKQRTNKGVKESLIRWKGWSKKFDSWIPTKDIKQFS